MAARLVLVVLVFWTGTVFSQGFDQAHTAWDALLKRDVVLAEGGKASRLRYAALAQERPALKGYLDSLARVGADEFASWTREQQMAFLINAYNAAMADRVLGRYPRIESVWDLGRIFSNPFKERSIALFGGQVSLDDIEHDYLRKRFRDPRVHYAVNCASIGCPMLREEAYVAERLERQLDEQAERFLSDRSRNRATGGAAGRLEVSKIFEWYREDFEPLPGYLGRYARLLSGDAAEQVRIAQGTLPIVFLDYDWSLNDARK